MASTIALFHYHLLVFVIIRLVPAIAQVNTNISQQDQFLLAIWFAKIPDETIVWSANRDYPAERESKVELNRAGQLELKAPGGWELWRSSNNENLRVSNGAMLDTGNFVVTSTNSSILWNSFDEPTNTMLPTQVLGFGSSLFSTMSEKCYGVGKIQHRFRPLQQIISNSSYDLIL
nr:g-type lectin s-receptor-like serine/threonine-protein kinase lecrk3 [Quercus suber]